MTQIPRIPGLPSGAKPVLFHQNPRDKREAVVLCDWDTSHTGQVCWKVNMIEGGCYYGVYDSPLLSFSQRSAHMI